MDEIKKVRKTIAKAMDGAPHETFLVLDATTGQNALQQAALFKDALDLTGIVLTKLDGTAKGGIVLAICDELGVPVRYIGLGERAEDLREFHADEFVEALFGKGEDEVAAA
jgi:fused signal recognition particle receptor